MKSLQYTLSLKIEPWESRLSSMITESFHWDSVKHSTMAFQFLLCLILPGVILILLQRLKRQRTSPQPPGPWGLPYFGNLFQLDAAALHIYLWQLSKKYGPLMSLKLGSNKVVVVSSPGIAKEVLKTHDLAFSGRPKLLGTQKLSYNGLDMAFAPYGKSWRELRKITVLHLLGANHVQSFRPVREDEVFGMINELSGIASTGMSVNLSEMMLSLTSSLICQVAFGKKLEEGGSEKTRFNNLTLEVQALFVEPFLSDYLPLFGWMDKLRGLIGRLDKAFTSSDEFYQELIEQHLDPNREKSVTPAILDLLIHLKQEHACSIDLTWDHIKGILMDIFIGGTDSAAATLVWAMTALMQNPKTMEKLQQEIRDLVKAQDRVNEDDITKLPYLKAVIKETLRLYPPAPLLIPREARESCIVDGYQIPSKTQVYINAWAIARDPEYWENPEEFLPERFLDTDVDIVGNDFQVIPFGAGRRGCPGISMGLAIVELALANLVYSFNWELPVEMKREDIDTEVNLGLTAHKKNPLCLVPKIWIFHD